MRLCERWQAFKANVDAEFNPGRDGDPEKIAQLESGLGVVGVDGATDITPPYGTPIVLAEGQVAEDDTQK